MKEGDVVVCPDGEIGIYISQKWTHSHRVLVPRDEGEGYTFLLVDSVKMSKEDTTDLGLVQAFEALQEYFKAVERNDINIDKIMAG